MKRALPVVLFAFLAGCPEKAAPPPPPVVSPVVSSQGKEEPASVASATVVEEAELPVGLVPLDAADGLALSAELAKTIREARARVPSRPSPEQRAALEELESRYERLEAAALAEPPGEGQMLPDRTPYVRVLAGFYWERLRLFSPDLEPELPEELLNAFLESGVRRE